MLERSGLDNKKAPSTDPQVRTPANTPKSTAREAPAISEYAKWSLQPDEQHQAADQPGEIQCWIGEFVGAQAWCCDPSQGPRGRGECWDQVFTFEACCPNAKVATEDVARLIRQVKGRIFTLERKLKAVSRDPRWFALAETCVKKDVMGKEFSICFFGDARQGSVSLGSFEAWDEAGHQQLYTGGQRCPSGPSRSLKLRLVCGAETKPLG